HTGEGLVELKISKLFRFVKNRVDVEYRVSNSGMEAVSAVFASEINLSFHSLDVGKLRLHARQGRTRKEVPPDAMQLDALSDLQFQDLHNNTVVTINPTERPDLWCFPVEAVGILWDHPHWFYQSNCAVLRWPISLDPGDIREFSVSLRIEAAK
ncbi:MAG: alpha-amylase/4-alpha-glucanotransferase domain-containing protein, partial [Alkalispirochaeta sp.]